MCPSIIDKYIQRFNYLSNISLIEFVAYYDIVNLRKKRKKCHIIRYVHYNEQQDPKNYYKEQLLLFIPFFDNGHTFKGDHSMWNMVYNMHETQINLLKKTFICNFDNNAYTTNWENIESQAFELATKNDINIWMDKFPNADIGFLHKILLIVLEWNHITFVMNILLTHV
jgi:hypothetical protein